MDKKAGFAIGLILLAIGGVFTLLVLNVLANHLAVEVLLGVLIGITITLILLYGLRKLFDFSELFEGGTNSSYEIIGSKVLALLGVEQASQEEIVKKGKAVVGTIKMFFSSMALFSVFAICVSIALYNTSLLQVQKLEEQNKLVTNQNLIVQSQNKLICSQNVLAEQANKLSIFTIESQRIDVMKKGLMANQHTYNQALNELENCLPISNSLEFIGCARNAKHTFEEVNKSYTLNKPDAYLENNAPDEIFDNIVSSKEKVFKKMATASDSEFYLKIAIEEYIRELTYLNKNTSDTLKSLSQNRDKLLAELKVEPNSCAF